VFNTSTESSVTSDDHTKQKQYTVETKTPSERKLPSDNEFRKHIQKLGGGKEMY